MFGQLNANDLASANRSSGWIPNMGDRYNELVGGGVNASQRWVDPAAADVDYVLGAVTDNGSDRTITTGIVNPDVPRAVSATADGTSGDIKAIQVIVTGTNIDDEVITETLPAFTANTAGTVSGSKAFKTVTQIVIPAHDGTGATTSVGILDKLGLDRLLPNGNTVFLMTADGVKEGTAPTVVTDADEVEKNTIDPNTALDGAKDFIAYWVDTNPYSA